MNQVKELAQSKANAQYWLKQAGVAIIGLNYEGALTKILCRSLSRIIDNRLNVALCSQSQLLAGQDFTQALSAFGVIVGEHTRGPEGTSRFNLVFDTTS